MSNETAIASLKEKIDDLNQHAWEVRVTDLPKSFELSQESVKLGRTINYPKGLAEGLRSLGFSYVRYSKNDEAAPLLKESLSLFQSLNDLKGQAVIYEYLGIIERNWGNLGASLDLLLKANELVLQIDSQEIELTCSYQLGVTYKHLGDHENALDYLYKTLSLAKKMNYPLMEAYATNIIGSIYFDNGNYNQALDCYQQGLPIRQQSNDKWGEAGSLDNIGFTYLKLNDLDKAIDHCKQSLAICQATGDKKGEANALLHLGEIYEQAGDIKQATDFSNKSLEIRKERGDKRGETEVLLFLAELYKNRNDIEEHQIFEWLSNALKIADEIKAQDLLSKAYYNLHEYYQQKGDFKESLVQLEAHFQIEKELHKNSISQKIANLEISHKAETISQRNKELTELNEKIEKANEELKIEAALERVRSASIAMHSSDELHKVIRVLTDQLSFLGFHFHTANFITNESMPDWEIWISSPGLDDTPPRIHVPYLDHFLFNERNNAITTGKEFLTAALNKMEKDKFFHYLFEETAAKVTPTERKEWVYQQKGMGLTTVLMKNISLSVINYDGTLYTTEENEVIKRLATVFEQSYTRFLDLQKAEAQARESQIQLAMERVRARTMAMQHSDELKDAASLLFKQLEGLGIKSWSSGFNIWEDDGRSAIINMCNPDGSIATPYHLPHTEEIFFIRIDEARQRGDELLVMETGGKDLEQTYNYMFSLPEVKKMLGGMEDTGFQIPKFQVSHCAFFSQGYLMFITYEPVPEMWDVFKRFAKVFEQTYTRFLDLQKSEAQSREAQIELALERVRARTMAMQRSDELRETVLVIYEQLQQLNFDSKACNIIIIDRESSTAQYWVSGFSQEIFPESYNVPYLDHPYQDMLLKPWKQGDKYAVYEYTGKMKQSFDEIFFTQTEFRNVPQEAKKVMIGLESVILSTVFISYGALQAIGAEPLSQEKVNILKRFAKVFEQTYTRFLDLQKAEAQAREAQIEAALEKVRSRSLAVHKSDDFKEVIAVVFEKIQELGIQASAVSINIFIDGSKDAEVYIYGKKRESFLSHYRILHFDHIISSDRFNARQSDVDFFSKTYTAEETNSFFEYEFEFSALKYVPDEIKKMIFESKSYTMSMAITKNSMIVVNDFEGKTLSQKEIDVVKRFAKVFEQTYTRFLDLQKAEAQAREAQIEAALERVRSRTMGMQKSEELKEVIQVVYEQFVHLNIHVEHTGFIMDYKQRNDMHIWLADKHAVPFQVTIPYFNCAHWNSFNEAKEKGMDFFANKLSFEEKNKFYQDLFKLIPDLPEETLKYYFSCPGLAISTVLLDNVGLYIENFSGIPYSDEENKTLMRFGKVFQQTYTRFLDLQKAEAQAREAQIEAALEKVRSRTLAMQKSDELAETAAEVFRQLIALGIEPNRLYIGIVKEETGDMEMWATDEDGTQVGKRFMFNKNENASVLKLYDGWKTQKKSVIVDMQGKELEDYFHYLNNVMHIPFKGGLTQKRRVQSVAYFSKGFIGMASPDGQGDETIQLLERFAAVFNLTFTRFNDLKIAEAHAVQAKEDLVKLQTEKKRAEDALSELQVTQKQLIQSEKMASLGELTAGIAHEIQNPLNFVNNFSDVNKELLGEMKEEIEKGNIDEVIAIANDIISNEEKINHHGKRADAIVKGMLQHSRSSSGVKEPTDINELADEYLRLAYHGLRAKDKSFNATMKTDFDEKIGKVNVIPQEIGRVFLNLITNAFYVVAEKKKQLANGYEPTVTVTTKKENDKVVVSVKDNGSGIPQKDLDKIFQPFFTTKPTGQGTGLGLSLSYDIVKAHSGEIKVKTKDGEGSEFVISLPVV